MLKRGLLFTNEFGHVFPKPPTVERNLQTRPENVRPLERHAVPPLLPEQQALQEQKAKLHPFRVEGVCMCVRSVCVLQDPAKSVFVFPPVGDFLSFLFFFFFY